MKTQTLSRRQFLHGTGALIVSFNLFAPASKLFAQNRVADGELDPQSLDSWIAISPDGTVTFFTSKVEIGTGIQTALAQIIAEELDVPFERVILDSGDTTKSIEQGSTVGSRTIERAGPQVRQASAAARQELLKLASARLGVPADKLTVQNGVVSATGDASKKVSYGQLIGGKKFNTRITATGTGWDMKVAPEVKAKDPKNYKIVGSSARRVELPAKVTGEHTYSNDVRIPRMLHGRVVRPPVVNTEPISIDHDSVRGIPGMVMIVREGKFVGVVAETEWAAIKSCTGPQGDVVKANDQVTREPRRAFRLLEKQQARPISKAGRQRRSKRGFQPSKKNLPGELSLAVSDAWHDRPVLRSRRRQRQQGNHLVRAPGTL
jgi:CO/xanthine dehydrogenase Mo-binding subunit